MPSLQHNSSLPVWDKKKPPKGGSIKINDKNGPGRTPGPCIQVKNVILPNHPVYHHIFYCCQLYHKTHRFCKYDNWPDRLFIDIKPGTIYNVCIIKKKHKRIIRYFGRGERYAKQKVFVYNTYNGYDI